MALLYRWLSLCLVVLLSASKAFVNKLWDQDIATPVSGPDYKRAPRRISLGECMAESVIYQPTSHLIKLEYI